MDYTHTHRGHVGTGARARHERGDLSRCQFEPVAVNCTGCHIFQSVGVAFPSLLLNKSSLHINTRVSGIKQEHRQLDATALQQAKKDVEERVRTEDLWKTLEWRK